MAILSEPVAEGAVPHPDVVLPLPPTPVACAPPVAVVTLVPPVPVVTLVPVPVLPPAPVVTIPVPVPVLVPVPGAAVEPPLSHAPARASSIDEPSTVMPSPLIRFLAITITFPERVRLPCRILGSARRSLA